MGFASLYPSYGTIMTAALPAFTDYEPFRAWRVDPAQWLPIAHDIARSHGLACIAPHVFATGTNLVLALDEKLILKKFPPISSRPIHLRTKHAGAASRKASDCDPRNRR